jgi:hypothetical protein
MRKAFDSVRLNHESSSSQIDESDTQNQGILSKATQRFEGS